MLHTYEKPHWTINVLYVVFPTFVTNSENQELIWLKLHKLPSISNFINSEGNGIVGRKLVRPARPCRVIFSKPEFTARIFAMVLKWNLHHHQLGYSKLVRQKLLRKALLLVLLSTSDYKRVYTSLYFIITTSTRSLNLMWTSAMAWILQHLHYTQYLINREELINHTAFISFDQKLK